VDCWAAIAAFAVASAFHARAPGPDATATVTLRSGLDYQGSVLVIFMALHLLERQVDDGLSMKPKAQVMR
jgi:hypothetical protein